MSAGPSRRARAVGGRQHSVRVPLSDSELATVRAAATRAGLSDASWVGEVSVAAATQPRHTAVPHEWGQAMQGLMGLRAELMEDRRVLRNVGGNLNDVARAANVDGTVHDAAERVLGLVERAVGRIDATVVELDGQVAAARAARLRGAR